MFRLHRFFLFLVAIAIVCACGFAVASTAYAEVPTAQDITPPSLVGVSFEPATIDTSNGPVTVTITAHITDDLSGFADMGLQFRQPATTQHTSINVRPGSEWTSLIAGDNLDGEYTTTLTLPQYAAFGAWEVYTIEFYDVVGNHSVAWKPDAGPTDYERTGWSHDYDAFIIWNGPAATPTPEPAQPETFALFLPTIAP